MEISIGQQKGSGPIRMLQCIWKWIVLRGLHVVTTFGVQIKSTLMAFIIRIIRSAAQDLQQAVNLD